MSLINQMLQDLEQRNASAAKTEPLSGEVRAVPSKSSGSPTVTLVLAIAIVALSVGGTWFYLRGHAPQPAAPLPPAAAAPVTNVPPQTVVASAGKHEATEQPAATNPAGAEATSKPVPVPAKAGQPSGVERPHIAKPMASEQETAKAGIDRSSANAMTASVVAENAAKVAGAEKQKQASKTSSVAAGSTVKTVTPEQQSDNWYRQGTLLMQQGRVAEAQELLAKSLNANPGNLKARQALVGLLVEAKHHEEAMVLLQEGLKLSPEQSGFSMALARLQVESGDPGAGIKTLEQGLSYAGEDAEYHAFYAALLQREGRHDDAVQHYLAALRTDPAMPTWLVGIGISLQTLGKTTDALEAFQRAKDTGQLTPQLAQFVEQRLGQLRH